MNRAAPWILSLLTAGSLLAGWRAATRPEPSWTLTQIDLPTPGPHRVSTPPAVTVAILDTGVPASSGLPHGGYDFVSDPRSAGDGTGRDPWPLSSPGSIGIHGAAMAVTVASVNPQARLIQVRIIGRANSATLRDAVDGLRWAAGLPVRGAPHNPYPARVINASFSLATVSPTGCARAMQQAVDEVVARGTVIVASAGNRHWQAARNTPAGCHGVLTVAATDVRGRRAGYSNWGRTVALAAPGGDAREPVEVSLPDGETVSLSGTSLAAPLVSGAVSLLLADRPELTPAQVRSLLQQSAQPFAGGQCDVQRRRSCGAGVLDVGAALRLAARSTGSLPGRVTMTAAALSSTHPESP